MNGILSTTMVSSLVSTAPPLLSPNISSQILFNASRQLELDQLEQQVQIALVQHTRKWQPGEPQSV